ncbi:MAG TPA: invasion associated locus B family protein [Stellaceae bacterium]|nr:invasion associated locus B family protein [Stellaceae bacterium]
MEVRPFLAPIVAFVIAASPALAQAPQSAPSATKPAATPAKPAPEPPKIDRLNDSQIWPAFMETGKTSKACYLVGHPQKSEPAGLKRGEIHLSITHRPSEKSYNVVNFAAGYPFKEGSEVEVNIDQKKFTLFTSKEGAWARDPATDKAITEALAKGKQVVVKGTSARGTNTLDTFSLAGFSQSIGEIDKACGVKR